MDSVVTSYLKRWAGLGKSADKAILYLPCVMGGFNLPRLSTLHKKLQVSRQCQLLTSRNACVRFLVDHNLNHELSMSRKKFRPATAARDTLAFSPVGNRKSLAKAAKASVRDADNAALLENLHSLERQGYMSRCTAPKAALVHSCLNTT